MELNAFQHIPRIWLLQVQMEKDTKPHTAFSVGP